MILASKCRKDFSNILEEIYPLIQTHFTTFEPLNHSSEPSH